MKGLLIERLARMVVTDKQCCGLLTLWSGELSICSCIEGVGGFEGGGHELPRLQQSSGDTVSACDMLQYSGSSFGIFCRFSVFVSLLSIFSAVTRRSHACMLWCVGKSAF